MNNMAKIIIDCYKGQIPAQYSQVSKEEREEAIRSELLKVMGLEKFEKKSFRKALRANQVAIFEVIEEIVASNFVTGSTIMSDFANRFCEIKNLALGDENLFYVEGQNDLIVSEYAGSHMTARRQRFQSGQSFKLEMRNFIISVYTYLEQVLAGRIDFATFVAKLYEAVDKKNGEMIVDAFNAGLSSLPATYKVTGSYNANNILTMLQHLEAANGVKPVLTGTTAALRKLQGIQELSTGGRLSDDMKKQINEQFFMPVWESYECVAVANAHKSGSVSEFVIPNDKVYAVAGDTKLVKIVFEGDAIVKENNTDFDNADLSLEYTLAYKANAVVAYSGLAGIIELA